MTDRYDIITGCIPDNTDKANPIDPLAHTRPRSPVELIPGELTLIGPNGNSIRFRPTVFSVTISPDQYCYERLGRIDISFTAPMDKLQDFTQ